MDKWLAVGLMVFLVVALSGCSEAPPDTHCINNGSLRFWAESERGLAIFGGVIRVPDKDSLGTITIGSTFEDPLTDIECVGSGVFASEIPGCPQSIGFNEMVVLTPQHNPQYSSTKTHTNYKGEVLPLLEGTIEITSTDSRGVRFTDTIPCEYRQ